MKKVRIMLSSVAVLAVIGGALAFKTYHSNKFYTLDATGLHCTQAVLLNSTITNIAPSVVIDQTLTSIAGTSGVSAFPCLSTNVKADPL